MQVLQQSIAQHDVICRVPHDGRNHGEASLPGGPPTPFTGDQFVFRPIVSNTAGTNDDGLQKTYFTDGEHQFGQSILVKDRSRLATIRPNTVNCKLGVSDTIHHFECRRHERINGAM